MFKKYGLRMMWVEQQREELNIRLKGKEMDHIDGFVYVAGMVTDNNYL